MSYTYDARSGAIVYVEDVVAPPPDPVTVAARAFAMVPPERLADFVAALDPSRLAVLATCIADRAMPSPPPGLGIHQRLEVLRALFGEARETGETGREQVSTRVEWLLETADVDTVEEFRALVMSALPWIEKEV